MRLLSNRAFVFKDSAILGSAQVDFGKNLWNWRKLSAEAQLAQEVSFRYIR
jgi:hypothetical protein